MIDTLELITRLVSAPFKTDTSLGKMLHMYVVIASLLPNWLKK